MIEVVTSSPAETLALGRRLAASLRPGDVVLLAGGLGSGKTLLASGIAEGLGVEEPVTSPSFVLLRQYRGFLPIYHADVYRLGSMGEFDDLDLAATAADGVLLVEWGHAVSQALPADHLVVEIIIEGDSQRRFRFRPVGTWGDRTLEDVAP